MLLSEHRQALGLTLAQCATDLGLSAKSVGWLSDIENGKRDASLRLALRIERWSGGAVTAASVNAEIRAGEAGTDEPGSHGGEVSVDDPAVVALSLGLGADNPERNVSRTSAAAFSHPQTSQVVTDAYAIQGTSRRDPVVGSIAGNAVQSAAQGQAREGVATGGAAGLAQLQGSEIGESHLDPSCPTDAPDGLDAQAVAIADVDDRAGEGLTRAQFRGHRSPVRDAGAGVCLGRARDGAEGGGDESGPNHGGNLARTEAVA